jgi:hypothetical protein
MRLVAIWLGMCLVMLAMGCGSSGPAMYPVQGEVRFDGRPIADGTMTLIPQ